MMRSKVLIVDDEPEVRDAIKSMLEPDYICTEAENGAAALELVKHVKFDFIISDYTMPVLDGFELIKSLYENGDSTPVLFLTGRGSRELHLHSKAFNVFEYLEKPVHPQVLRSTLEKCALLMDHSPRTRASNWISRLYYEDFDVKISRETASAIRDYSFRHGLSASTVIERLVTKYLKPGNI